MILQRVGFKVCGVRKQSLRNLSEAQAGTDQVGRPQEATPRVFIWSALALLMQLKQSFGTLHTLNRN
jgi:hypothetical protein